MALHAFSMATDRQIRMAWRFETHLLVSLLLPMACICCSDWLIWFNRPQDRKDTSENISLCVACKLNCHYNCHSTAKRNQADIRFTWAMVTNWITVYTIYYILYTLYVPCTMYHVPCTMYYVLYYRLFMYYVLGTIYYIPILENGCQSIGIYIPIMLGFDDCVPIQPIWTWHTSAQRCLSWHPWTSFGKEPWRESISADIMSGWFQTAQSNIYI